MNFIVLDTETTNSIDEPICYDVGWTVINSEEKILATRSYVVAEMFIEEKDLLNQAYYADKIPQYLADIESGKRKLARYKTIKEMLAKDVKNFDVKGIIAHNARFDYRAVNLTQRWFTSSKYRYFLPYGVPIYDTLRMARETFGEDDDYIKFCEDNDFCCKNGTPRFTAEILTRYLTKNLDFEESHTGLEDTLIESSIFFECLKRGCEPKSPWR